MFNLWLLNPRREGPWPLDPPCPKKGPQGACQNKNFVGFHGWLGPDLIVRLVFCLPNSLIFLNCLFTMLYFLLLMGRDTTFSESNFLYDFKKSKASTKFDIPCTLPL